MRQFVFACRQNLLPIMDKSLGMIVGFLFFPLKSIVLNIFMIFLNVLVTLSFLVLLPALLMYYLAINQIRWPLIFLSSLIMPVMWLGVGLLFAVSLLIIPPLTIFDVTRSMWLGLKAGFTLGTKQTFVILRSQYTPFSLMIHTYHNYFFSRNHSQQVDSLSDSDFANLDLSQLIDVKKSPGPDLSRCLNNDSQNRPSFSFNPAHIQTLLEEFKDRKQIPVKHDGKKIIDKLSSLFERYINLNKTLQMLAENIAERKNNPEQEIEGFPDEIMTNMEVNTPMLLMKQYYCEIDQAWYVVPATTKITDRDLLTTWFKQKGTHPLTNESITNPPEYKGKSTRYQWYTYNGRCVELEEIAWQIISLMNQLSNFITDINPKDSTSGSSLKGAANLILLSPPKHSTSLNAKKMTQESKDSNYTSP